MRPLERELGFAVVERLDAAPCLLDVASVAFFAEPTLMRILFLVTIEALAQRLAELGFRYVAADAWRRPVGTAQFEVGKRVVKRLPIQLHHVEIAPLVIRMAMAAFLFCRFGRASMETFG